MNNNKAFSLYAALLIAGVASVITSSVVAGFATLPSFFVFVEHVAVSLLFRASYKSYDGPYHILDSLRARKAAEAEAKAPVGSVPNAA